MKRAWANFFLMKNHPKLLFNKKGLNFNNKDLKFNQKGQKLNTLTKKQAHVQNQTFFLQALPLTEAPFRQLMPLPYPLNTKVMMEDTKAISIHAANPHVKAPPI